MTLQERIDEIVENGIDVDVDAIKKDVCSQFENPNMWIREAVVNSADSLADTCFISACGDGKFLKVVIEDSGMGMCREQVMAFCHIFRSLKPGNPHAVGTHGIGRLSVAAIPNQTAYVVKTSTGSECWRITAGCLLESTPIKLERIEPAPPRGTRVEITFENHDGSTPASKLREYGDLLEKYLRHLNMKVVIFEMDAADPPAWATPIKSIEGGSWDTPAERAGRHYSFELGEHRFHVVVGIRAGEYELYQRNVLVSEKYNLLSRDLPENMVVPYLKIRVDSPDFELPFGRNLICNEPALNLLSRYLRIKILPRYFNYLHSLYETGKLKENGVFIRDMEEIACAFLLHEELLGKRENMSWRRVSLFTTMNSHRLSFEELQQAVSKSGVLYFEKQHVPGTDYGAFKAPVISGAQSKNALKVLHEHFSKELVFLGGYDVIVEMPRGRFPAFGEKEKAFQGSLGFHRVAVGRVTAKRQADDRYNAEKAIPEFLRGSRLFRKGLEARLSAERDLCKLKWRVSFLMHGNGAPCRTHRYLLKADEVILNLYHPEIQNLCLLSEKDPRLAGHLAMVMCLTDGDSVLSHVTPQVRDELLIIDAICRVQGAISGESRERSKSYGKRKFRDFIRDLEETERPTF